MSGVRIEVVDAEIQSGLARLAEADRADAMRAIGAYLLTASQRRIERQVGPDGKPWKRLSRRTAEKRIGQRRRGHDNMLRVSNRLFSSLVFEAAENEVSVGTNVVYAAIQHEGGTIKREARRQTIFQRYNEKTGDLTGFVPRRRSNFARDVEVKAHEITVPARPWMGIDDADRREIAAILADHYGEGIEP